MCYISWPFQGHLNFPNDDSVIASVATNILLDTGISFAQVWNCTGVYGAGVEAAASALGN